MKLLEGKRSAVMTTCLIYGLLWGGLAKLGVSVEVVTSALTFGGVLAGLYFGGQSYTDSVSVKNGKAVKKSPLP